jgi:hypothetical protein
VQYSYYVVTTQLNLSNFVAIEYVKARDDVNGMNAHFCLRLRVVAFRNLLLPSASFGSNLDA